MKKMPHSIRKHIRKEKARIRREILGWKDQEEQIQNLYERFLKNKKSRGRASTELKKEENKTG